MNSPASSITSTSVSKRPRSSSIDSDSATNSIELVVHTEATPLIHDHETPDVRPGRQARSRFAEFFDLSKLCTRAFLSLTSRLWFSSILLCCLYIVARRLPPGIGGLLTYKGQLMSRDLVNHLEVIYPTIPSGFFELFEKPRYAIPALFGDVLDEEIVSPVVFLENDGCSSFDFSFPTLSKEQSDLLNKERNRSNSKVTAAVKATDANRWDSNKDNGKRKRGFFTSSSQESRKLGWIAVVPRGGCPFDEKVYNIQESGFRSVIIYNNVSISGKVTDSPVRMSAYGHGAYIFSYSSFLTEENGLHLVDQNAKVPNGDYMILSVLPTEWDTLPSRGTLKGTLIDLILLWWIVTVSSSLFLGTSIILGCLRNFVVYGQFYLVAILHEGCHLILTPPPASSPVIPKLKTIPFPSRVIQEEDLRGDPEELALSWGEGGSGLATGCAICLDEFTVGNSVRALPCHHTFHDTCVDPWLLKHNRLCPTCKRDVLSPGEIPCRKPRSRDNSLDEEEGEV